MFSYHLCLLISCNCLVVWILSFDYSSSLIAWYLYICLFVDTVLVCLKPRCLCCNRFSLAEFEVSTLPEMALMLQWQKMDYSAPAVYEALIWQKIWQNCGFMSSVKINSIGVIRDDNRSVRSRRLYLRCIGRFHLGTIPVSTTTLSK